MCGIFGFVGARDTQAASIVFQGLRELEYRGYDSWGIATLAGDGIVTKKAIGKVSEADHEEFLGMRGTMAIGHSRWATHGGVTKMNSHPHQNKDGTITVVHNGIIENHNELRALSALQLGVTESELFVSETDTEVIPHLIDSFIRRGETFESAFASAGRLLEGRFAIVAMRKDEPYLLAMRDGSPLVLGRSTEGYFLASDVPAFLDHTRIVCYPGDRECIKILHDNASMSDLEDGKSILPEWTEVIWDKARATKEGFPHFMLKEIMEQPTAIDAAIRQEAAKLERVAHMMNASKNLFFIGCGTAAKMAQLGEQYALRVGGKLTRAIVASEFAPYERFLDADSLLFAVSQSGETGDVLEALRAGAKRGAAICSLLNVVGSSVDRISKESIFINTGPEIAVASTKAATAQIAVLFLIAHALEGKLALGKELLLNAVARLREWVTPLLLAEIETLAIQLRDARDIYIIGRGLHSPIAQEAAIKIQEVSYIHAEGFSGGELKHGPIALISHNTPIIAFVPNDETKRDMQSNITELKSRGAFVVGIGPEHSPLFDVWISTPDLGLASPIGSLIPLQLLAYHLALLRGNDPDKPRNLAKSVTVK